MKNNMGNRSRRNTMAIAILCVLGILSVAYAAFSTNLKINLTGSSENKWNIQFSDNIQSFSDVGISMADEPTCGAISLDKGKVNLEISGMQFVNLDNKFCYLIPVVNSGNVNATLSTAPSITLSGSKESYSYYDSTKEEQVNYDVTYNSNLYNLGAISESDMPKSYSACMDKAKESSLVGKNDKINAGETIYWLLSVDATYNTDNQVSGNTVFEGDNINCTAGIGTWSSKDKELPPD